ncbi:MAG: DNA recombination protein RmuC [Acidobacteriia bacterium]|nr:DNA recombination protein RmuC [Terriglobia bacterium]
MPATVIAIIAVLAAIIAAIALVAVLRRPSGADDQVLQAVRNDVNLLRETTDRSIKQITDVFSQQLQGIGSNVQTALASVNSEVANRLEAINKNVGDRLGENARAVQTSSEAVNARIATVQSTFANLQKQVGEMSEQARALAEASKSITSLERALTAPKARGGFGETSLEALLQQVFAAHQYQMQYPFKSGEVADAMLFFPQGSVVIDSKFPLENFRRITDAATDLEKKAARREFIKDVKKRIDEIATKYILPAEGTLPFALMYVPAENVYYEAVIREEEGSDLYGYSVERHVMPVSPNSLYAYLHTIMVGLNGMRISQRAEAILREIQSLRVELGKFADEYQTVGKHLRNASTKFDDSARQLGKVETRVSGLANQAGGAEELGEPEQKRALGAGGN